MEEERKSRILIDIRHPSPMIPGKAIVKCLEESANLVFVCFGPREDYDCFTKVEGQAGSRFILYQLMIFTDVSWELLSEEVPL
jgi:hypothetical protein